MRAALVLLSLCFLTTSAHAQRRTQRTPWSPPAVPAPPPPPPAPPRLEVAPSDPPLPPPLAAPTVVDPHRGEEDFAFGSSLADFHLDAGAVAVLGRIAQNPLHPRCRDAVARLSRIARALPEGADLERLFGAVTPQVVASIAEPEVQSGAAYLLGRHRYDAGRYDEAIAALAAVADRDPNRPRALLLAGAAHVRLRRSVPAVQSFQAALAILDSAPPSYDRAYFRDLALMAMAQTYDAAALRLDENNAPTIDSSKLSAAVKSWEMLDTGSALWAEAAYEMSWAFLMAGDLSKADPLPRLLASSAMPTGRAASARAMRVVIQIMNCNYDEAQRQILALRAVVGPMFANLGATMASTDALRREDAYFGLLIAVRDGRAAIPADVAAAVGRSLADRSIARRLSYLARLDAESQLLARSLPFATTPGGAVARTAIDAERARVVATISAATREHLEIERSEMAERLDDARRLEGAAAAAAQGHVDQNLAVSQLTQQEAERNIPRPTPPFIAPFQRGLPDDVRRYGTFLFKTSLPSKCGR
jgi:tetratricopeptide (TPR) repeat protein